MELTLVVLVSVAAVLRPAASAQSSVYVKFLSPPHGYSHNLQVGPSGVAISKESRIYPGDDQPFGNHLINTQQKYTFNNQYRPSLTLDNQFRQGYFQNNQYRPGYPQNIQYQPGYPLNSQFLRNEPLNNQLQQSTGYLYSRPQKPFDTYGPPTAALSPSKEFGTLSRPEAEMSYDPNLITGPEAARYVAYLFSQGELFFHLIPHERLVLMNQQERIANNLTPHILASIRPGHPFFLHR